MVSFIERVKRDQETHGGVHVFKLPRTNLRKGEPIDLICMNKNGKDTFICARGGGHSKLHAFTKLRLQMLGKQCGARVLHAKVNGENELAYKIIYERRSKPI